MSQPTMEEWRDTFHEDEVVTSYLSEEECRDSFIRDMLKEYRTLLRALTLLDAAGQLDNGKLTEAIALARKFA